MGLAERYADGMADFDELVAAQGEVYELLRPVADPLVPSAGADWMAYWATEAVTENAAFQTIRRAIDAGLLPPDRICRLFREIFGSPHSRRNEGKVWNATVAQLAEALYRGEDCAFALHDALLEDGATELAEHFTARAHPKGCWAVDALTCPYDDELQITWPVADVLSSPKSFLGQRTIVRGVLVSAGLSDDCWLAPDRDSREAKRQSVFLDSPGLFERLNTSVPPCGGNQFTYSHEAVVRGTVAPSSRRGFPLGLRDLTFMRACTRVGRYTVPL